MIATVAGVFVVFGLASGWLQRTPVTGPMVALAAGWLLGPALGVLPTELESGGVLLLAELSLAVLLFVDASRINVMLARRNGQVPARMLALGLPLVVATGTLVGMPLLGLSLPAALVLACLLAPTDAALAQPLLADERVPLRVRQAVNVESGLNDGLVAPVLAVALVVADAAPDAPSGALGLASQAAILVGVGLLVGAGVGAAVGLVLRAVDWRSLQPAPRQVGTAAVPLVAFATSTLLGGNGFIAAFVAGLAFGQLVDGTPELLEFGEDAGALLSLLTFLVFGAVFLRPAANTLSAATAAYALLSLTVIRILPIGLSLLGAGLRSDTVGLLGWFGPRGLATVVFGLEVLELGRTGALSSGEELFGIASLVVVASVVLHGLSARPLVGAYATAIHQGEVAMPEQVEVPDLPVRRTNLGR